MDLKTNGNKMYSRCNDCGETIFSMRVSSAKRAGAEVVAAVWQGAKKRHVCSKHQRTDARVPGIPRKDLSGNNENALVWVDGMVKRPDVQKWKDRMSRQAEPICDLRQQQLRDDMFYSVHGFYPPTQPRDFQIVEHTPRAERDAALIDTTGPEILSASITVCTTRPRCHTESVAARANSHRELQTPRTLKVLDRERDSSWMRGGYKSEQRIVTTCDVGADWED